MLPLALLSPLGWCVAGAIALFVLWFLFDEIRWIRRDNEYRRFPLRRWLWAQVRRVWDFLTSF